MNKAFEALAPKVVLGVAAHPDDLDFGASASMAKFASQGAEIYYLILTDGSKGSADRSITSEQLIKMRRSEQLAAIKAVGGKDVTFLDYPDAALEISQALKRDIVREIRRLKPDVVITMDPSVLYSEVRGFINHPDHRAAGQATIDAVFPLARDYLTFPELLSENLEPHKVKTLLLTNFDKQNFYIDVSNTLDKKIAALEAHASQISDMDSIKQWITDWAAKAGKQAGYNYAEGFIRLELN